MATVIPLKVAVRSRPLIEKEKNEGCQLCLSFVSGEPQIIVGKNRAFTYDHVFSESDLQPEVYEEAVKPLVKHIFKGYNATVLAYGQTGSGKTFTMGGGYADSLSMDPIGMGVIPRIVKEIFEGIDTTKENYTFTLKCSYLEIINEELQDLLTAQRRDSLTIREENGEIKLPGLREVTVASAQDTMRLLEQGSHNRTTAMTAMNSTSSRSHAIFTIFMEEKNNQDINDVRRSKLQLVDLAGSERVKRTHAEGERFKEGVNINKGLLALGNVISALGDETQKRAHIPYRDSKLTRILQDSLGGNSHTLMIACVSPADSNIEETLNTLRYADRARKIKNKPIVNIDPQQAEIMRLRSKVEELQMQLINAGLGDGQISTSSLSSIAEYNRLVEKCAYLEEENTRLTAELRKAINQSTNMCEKAIHLEMKCERLRNRLADFEMDVGLDFDLLSSSINTDTHPKAQEQLAKLKTLAEKLKVPESSEENIEGEESTAEEENDDGDQLEESPESREISKQHMLRQVKMNDELQTLTKLLEQKEQLAVQASKNGNKFDTMTELNETKLHQYEDQISRLEKEKDSLAHALEEARTNAAASKISEQRRKRLHELEQQMSELRKKLIDHKKMLKHKEQSDKHVSKLNTEIQALKQQRVKLMKQMKEDADGFRRLKQQKDKEVLQLQQKDRKRQFEIQKLQRENQKTQNVLHRKAQEAASANRRLKEALARQRKVLEERNQKFEKCDGASVGNRVRKWLSEELEIRVSVSEAKYHRENLMQDRKDLAEKLKQLKETLDDNGPPSKKLAWMDDSGLKCQTSFKEEDTKKIHELQEQIEMRNVQIADLQQKIFDADQEVKPKAILENIHSMMEAKCGVKWLMDQAVSYKAHSNRLQSDKEEMKENMDTDGTANDCLIEQLETDLKKQRLQHETELTKLKKKHEQQLEEVYSLMLNPDGMSTDCDIVNEDNPQKRLLRQQSVIEQMKKSMHELQQDKEKLEQHLTKLMYQEKSIALLPDLKTDDDVKTSDPCSPFLTPRPKLKAKPVYHQNDEEEEEQQQEEEEEEEEDEEEIYLDPDWIGTPMYRGQRTKNPYRKRKTGLFDQTKDRLSDGAICGCRSNCSTKRCSCKKNGQFCSDYCKCVMCSNRVQSLPESTTQEDAENSVGSSVLNTTFDVDSSTTTSTTESQRPEKRSVLGLVPQNDSYRSSEEFVKPMTKKASSSDLGRKKSKDLKKHVSAGDLRKKSSTGELKMNNSSEFDSVLEGGLKKKRKLLSKTESFFEPIE